MWTRGRRRGRANLNGRLLPGPCGLMIMARRILIAVPERSLILCLVFIRVDRVPIYWLIRVLRSLPDLSRHLRMSLLDR